MHIPTETDGKLLSNSTSKLNIQNKFGFGVTLKSKDISDVKSYLPLSLSRSMFDTYGYLGQLTKIMVIEGNLLETITVSSCNK